MFAALIVVRLREAVTNAGLGKTKSWVSPDQVEAVELPLAKAAEKVLGSMQSVLQETKRARDETLEGMAGPLGVLDKEKDSAKRVHLRKTKATEVRLVRNLDDLRNSKHTYRAKALGNDEQDALGEDRGPGAERHLVA